MTCGLGPHRQVPQLGSSADGAARFLRAAVPTVDAPGFLSFAVDYFRLDGEAHELGQVPDTKLFHDPGLVDLNRAHADAEDRSDFLRVQAFGGVLEDFAFACRQEGELRSFRRALKPLALAAEGGIDCGAQLHLVERLFEKIYRLGEERAARRRYVAVRGDDDEGQASASCTQLGLKLDAARAWETQIGHNAAPPLGSPCLEKRLRMREEGGAVARQPKHQSERVAHRGVVLDDEDR